MAHMAGLSEEQEQEVINITNEINSIEIAINGINKSLGYYDGDVKVSKDDLEVVLKSALKYQKELLNRKSEYLKIIEDNTPKPSFR